MKSAIVLIADGSEEVEALSPVDYLRRAGVDVSIVSVGTASRTVTLSRKVSVNADTTLEAYLSAASGSLPDAIIVPGGMPGTTNIADSRSAVALAEEMHKAGKLVCAICAAPAFVLSKTSALEGKSWAGYPGTEGNAGAFVSGYQADKPFIHDGNVITARGPGAAEEFSMEIVRTLCGESVADNVKKTALLR